MDATVAAMSPDSFRNCGTTVKLVSVWRQVRSTDARNGTTTNTLDALDRVVAVQTPAPATGESPQTTGYHYDRFGRVTAVTNADQTVTFKDYYDTGELKKTSGARTYPVEYTYDYAGPMKTMKTWRDYAGNSGAAITTWSVQYRAIYRL